MKGIITITGFLFLLIIPIAMSLPDKIFVLEIIISSDDNTTLLDFKIAEGVPDNIIRGQANEEYSLTILSASGEVLFERKLPVYFQGFPDEEIAEGSPPITITRDTVKLFLKLPYFSEARKIEIYHLDKKIFDFTVPEEKKIVCGNDICENGETNLSCPSDCEEGVTTVAPPTKQETPIYLYVIVAVIIVAIVIMFARQLKIQR